MTGSAARSIGGTSARLVALSTAVFIATTGVASWQSQQSGGPSSFYVLSDYALALWGISGLAVVPALSRFAAGRRDDWLHLTAMLATLGFAVVVVTSFWQAEYEMSELVAWHAQGAPRPEGAAPSVREHLLQIFQELASRTPGGWVETAAAGLWMLTVSRRARARRLFTPGLARLGIAAGLLALTGAAAASMGVDVVDVAGRFAGTLVLMPLWFAGTATVLRRAAERRDGTPGAQESGAAGHGPAGPRPFRRPRAA